MDISLKISRLLVLWNASLEALVLTVALPLIGFGIRKDDPFYLNCQFPWLVLAPLLISLRYGFLFSMGSVSLLITSFALGRYFNWVATPFFPVEMAVGMLLITLITAEFHNLWQHKIQRLQHKHDYLNLRMNEFSRTYHLLKGSHSQLEHQLTRHTKSIRTSLLGLERKIQTLLKHEGEPLKGIGEHILNLLSEYGSIQTASLYEVSEGQKLSLNLRPIAFLGKPPSCWPNNSLIREAFKTGCVTSLQNIDEELGQDILVVIPLIDVYRKIWGMVIVNEMPLFALQERTLDLLALLGGHIGDLIQHRTETNLLSKDVWAEFECELHRVLRDGRIINTESAVVVSIMNSTQAYDVLMARFHSELRGLDKVMNFHDDFGRQIIITLLPMTDENGLKDFLLRLGLVRSIDSKTLAELKWNGLCGFNLIDNNVMIYGWTLKNASSLKETLSKVAQLCHRKDPVGRNENEISA